MKPGTRHLFAKWTFYLSSQVLMFWFSFHMLPGAHSAAIVMRVLASVGMLICVLGYANALGFFEWLRDRWKWMKWFSWQ